MGSLGGRASTADGASMDTDRLQVFSMGGPAPLLDVTPDCIDWPEEGGPNLTVMDVLDILGKHPSYCAIICLDPHSTRWELDVDEEMRWGGTYQLVVFACPRCTLCKGCCTRQMEPHELCMHGLSGLESGVHMWHDLRTRPQRLDLDRSLLRRHVSIQGYQDGLGLEREFDLRSMTQELQDIARETLDLVHDEQHGWSSWHAWERRTAGALRTALRASRETVNRQAAGG